MNRAYLHITRNDLAEDLLKTGIIDNSQINGNTFGENHGIQYIIDGKGPVKAFVWDIEKIQESGYLRTAPWRTEEHIEKMHLGKRFWIWPRLVDRYKVEDFRAITFNISNEVRRSLEHGYMIDRESGESLYMESATHKAVKMLDIEEVGIQKICTEILGMKEPFITEKFPEGNDGFNRRRLDFQSNIAYREL